MLEPPHASHEWLRERIAVRRRMLERERDPDEREAIALVIFELEGVLDEHVLAVATASE